MADIICPSCSGRYHETTDAFKLGVTTTGNMLRLKEPYRSNGWTSFPEHEGMSYGALECPECGNQYSSDGRVRVDMDQWAKEDHPESVKELSEMDKIMAEYDPELPVMKRKPGRPRK